MNLRNILSSSVRCRIYLALKSMPEIRNDELEGDAERLQHEKYKGLEAQISRGHHVSTSVPNSGKKEHGVNLRQLITCCIDIFCRKNTS